MNTLTAIQHHMKSGPYKGGLVTQFFYGRKRIHVLPVDYPQPKAGQPEILINCKIYKLTWMPRRRTKLINSFKP